MQTPEHFDSWILSPPHSYAANVNYRISYDETSADLLLESLKRHAEIKGIGRKRFQGSLQVRNNLWMNYRNYLRQAISNYSAALSVPNRSACLLYYYAVLNFAKAELLDRYAPLIVDKRIGHGLSFSPTRAKTIKGDVLTVQNGVFPLLYERRTGKKLPIGTRLPIARLLSNVPEIGQQLMESEIGYSKCSLGFTLQALTKSSSWIIMLVTNENFSSERTTHDLFMRHFSEIDSVAEWRDRFSFTRRYTGLRAKFYESINKFPHLPGGYVDQPGHTNVYKSIGDIIGPSVDASADVIIAPYLYKTKTLSMPPSLARYALTYYASSLVRYRPQMFDASLYPEQAYLFDGIARECARPMLVDTISHLDGIDHYYQPAGWFRN